MRLNSTLSVSIDTWLLARSCALLTSAEDEDKDEEDEVVGADVYHVAGFNDVAGVVDAVVAADDEDSDEDVTAADEAIDDDSEELDDDGASVEDTGSTQANLIWNLKSHSVLVFSQENTTTVSWPAPTPHAAFEDTRQPSVLFSEQAG